MTTSKSISDLSTSGFSFFSITRSYLMFFFLSDRKLSLSSAARMMEDGVDEVGAFCDIFSFEYFVAKRCLTDARMSDCQIYSNHTTN